MTNTLGTDIRRTNSCDNIIEHLWIGDHVSARDEDFLVKNNIRLVVNCTKDLQIPRMYKNLGIKVVRLPIDDINNEETNRLLQTHMDHVVTEIHRHRQQGNNVLVHCFAGMSRSATSVACYLIKYYEHTYRLAVMYIQAKRPITFRPNPNFETFLSSYS